MADTTKNALFVDVMPFINSIIGMMVYNFNCRAFGFGLQYERRLYEKWSLVGRYDYFGVWDFSQYSYVSNMDIKDWSLHLHTFETHARYYPIGKTFFLDGMLGYYVNTIKGYYYIRDIYEEDYNINGTNDYDYFKGGTSIGWQIRFRKIGGLTWELSLGWNFALSDKPGSYVWENHSFFLGGAGPNIVSAFGLRF